MFDNEESGVVSGFLRDPWNLVIVREVSGVSLHIWDIY